MITIRELTVDDIPFCMRLKEQAGWNQTVADWRRFLALGPQGGFQADYNGQPAGTVIVCHFGPVAWVCMMLVDESLRGKGIGRALMTHAIETADGMQVRSLRLDATPMGQPLYETLGFKDDFALTRFAGTAQGRTAAPAVKPISVADAAELDQRVTRTNRRRMLELLADEAPLMGVVERGTARGYLSSRAGSRATFIGPCLADEVAGPLLFAEAFHRFQGEQVFIDIPQTHTAAIQIAEEQGFIPQRPLLRMTRGEPLVEDVAWLWASSGPEKG